MSAVLHENFIKTTITSILNANLDPPLTVNVYTDSLPPERSDRMLYVLIKPSSPSFNDETNMKRVNWEVSCVSGKKSLSKDACSYIWEGMKNLESSDSGKKVLVTALTLPSNDGVDGTGNPVYSVMFQLTSRH